jgi:hypothetical protein
MIRTAVLQDTLLARVYRGVWYVLLCCKTHATGSRLSRCMIRAAVLQDTRYCLATIEAYDTCSCAARHTVLARVCQGVWYVPLCCKTHATASRLSRCRTRAAVLQDTRYWLASIEVYDTCRCVAIRTLLPRDYLGVRNVPLCCKTHATGSRLSQCMWYVPLCCKTHATASRLSRCMIRAAVLQDTRCWLASVKVYDPCRCVAGRTLLPRDYRSVWYVPLCCKTHAADSSHANTGQHFRHLPAPTPKFCAVFRISFEQLQA